jgi:hypothetical protein
MDDEILKIMNEQAKAIRIMGERFDKLKEIIQTYLSLGNDFALASLKTSLKNV